MSEIAHTLSREAEAARTLLLNIKDVIGDDEQAAQDAIEGETNFKEAMSAAANRLAEIKAMRAALKDRKTALTIRDDRLEAQSEAIRAAMVVAMATADVPRLELAEFTLSRSKVAPSLIITDEASIPSEYWKRGDPKLDRKMLSESLKAKLDVPGATLSNGGETISIRDK